MYRFFYSNDYSINENNNIIITGNDLKHIKVLRLTKGENIVICQSPNKEYYCSFKFIEDMSAVFDINEIKEVQAELPAKIYLFQGLPKKDKMEFIIQKAVELGVYEIVPVMTKRSVVKLDFEKESKRLKRWQSICEAAAKQSGRGIIPKVTNIMNFNEAVNYAKDLDYNIIPYELATNVSQSKEIVSDACKNSSIGIFIGAEGGFDKDEIDLAFENNFKTITLGKRILRTETAGMTVLSILMFEMETNDMQI